MFLIRQETRCLQFLCSQRFRSAPDTRVPDQQGHWFDRAKPVQGRFLQGQSHKESDSSAGSKFSLLRTKQFTRHHLVLQRIKTKNNSISFQRVNKNLEATHQFQDRGKGPLTLHLQTMHDLNAKKWPGILLPVAQLVSPYRHKWCSSIEMWYFRI